MVVLYLSIVLQIVVLLIGVKIFPLIPAYAQLKLGTRRTVDHKLEISDYFKILRKDYIWKYRTEERFKEYSLAGLLILMYASFSSGVCMFSL